MQNFKVFIYAALFTVVSCSFTIAQPPPSIAAGDKIFDKKTEQTFTSIEGGFKIGIPNNIIGFAGLRLRDTGNLGTGGLYTFELPEANYQIGYINLKPSIEKLSDEKMRQRFDQLQKLVIDKMFVKKDAVKNRKDFKFKSFPADQFVAETASRKTIVRHILRDDEIYILMASFTDVSSIPKILAKFDSLDFISNKELILEKVKLATPEPLPQTPSARRLTNDAQDENLKGKVKTLFEYSEDLSGEWYANGKKPDSEDYFDEQSNKIKTIRYDYKGLPDSVKVYGFIKGNRVISENFINYESQPPIAAAPQNIIKIEPKKTDSRFSSKYIYKYDEKDCLKEISIYNNSGELSRKNVYEFSPNQITESWFDKDNKLINKTIEVYDEKNNLIRKIFVSLDPKRKDSVYEYTYEEFDETGNWTKRIVKGKEGIYGGGYKNQHYIKYRTIEYYQ